MGEKENGIYVKYVHMRIMKNEVVEKGKEERKEQSGRWEEVEWSYVEVG